MIDPQDLSVPNRLTRVLLACVVVFVAIPSAFASSLRDTPMVKAVREARPSVVNIHGKKTVPNYEDSAAGAASYKQVNGMGTGVIIDERGYAITNYHVIEGVHRIQITLADHRTTTARLVAHDPGTDLAVIKLQTDEPMPVIKIGTSSDLMPAEPVVAVGNAYGYRHTVTKGIISELERTVQVSDEQTYSSLIQTDASINPGNSGGPLLNIDGEMIGINVAVRVGAQGIGFAIPVDQAMEVASRLLAVERDSSHGIVGKTVHVDRVPHFVVGDPSSSSPAGKAKLKSGDVIAMIDGLAIHRALDIERAFLGVAAGDQIPLTVLRGEETVELNMEIEAARSRVKGQSVASGRAWNLLGVRFVRVPSDGFRRLGTEYRGGLRIIDVRESSVADRQGIKAGDILVGMHLWETTSADDLTYILNRPDLVDFQPMKFYIIRGKDTLYGHMRVSVASKR